MAAMVAFRFWRMIFVDVDFRLDGCRSLFIPLPLLFPLYEKASRLGMPICVHASLGNLEMFDIFGRGASLA